jgi:enamine deaminase RidA (YjgF/YER057c/UK114 family)
MRESTRTNQDASGDSVEPHDRQPRVESAPAICYRMQPDRQMLHGSGSNCDDCSVIPREAISGGSNQMPPCLLSEQQHSRVNLDRVCRIALMVTPQPSEDVIDQAWEAVSTIRAIMKQQAVPMTVTMQTVFIRSADDIPALRKLFEAYYGDHLPVTNFVVQPPCGGEALAIEAWALGGHDVDVNFLSPDVVTVAYDGLRWIYVAGISSPADASGAYAESEQVFEQLASRLEMAGTSFKDVPRVWLYQGGITASEADSNQQPTERYRELNRSRTEFFIQQQSLGRMVVRPDGRTVYPASTGIGTSGSGLTVSCLALQTSRDDVRLVPLENPGQVSAFDYGHQYSIKSPKFSRAMAVAIGDYVTTWISGTASILNSETVHLGDIEKQTEQTIDNIERLISPENFARHGLPGTGAQLTDLAKVRVYVKNLEDYAKCREVCRRRFGALPSIYARADVCRSDLLVEIEGVAFSKLKP